VTFDALAFLLVVLAVIDWISAVILVRGALICGWPALSDRAISASITATFATIVAVLALTRTGMIEFPPGVGFALLAIGCVIVSISSLVWLVRYWRGDFADPL
jgi:hypothetical protein